MTKVPLKQTIVYGDCFTFPMRNPRAFGPAMWFTLHNGAANYPHRPTSEQMTQMKGFILGLPLMIPCAMCRAHFQALLDHTRLDDAVKSRETLFYFFFRAHNIVNKRLGKPVITLEEAKTMYAFYGETGTVLVHVTKTS